MSTIAKPNWLRALCWRTGPASMNLGDALRNAPYGHRALKSVCVHGRTRHARHVLQSQETARPYRRGLARKLNKGRSRLRTAARASGRLGAGSCERFCAASHVHAHLQARSKPCAHCAVTAYGIVPAPARPRDVSQRVVRPTLSEHTAVRTQAWNAVLVRGSIVCVSTSPARADAPQLRAPWAPESSRIFEKGPWSRTTCSWRRHRNAPPAEDFGRLGMGQSWMASIERCCRVSIFASCPPLTTLCVPHSTPPPSMDLSRRARPKIPGTIRIGCTSHRLPNQSEYMTIMATTTRSMESDPTGMDPIGVIIPGSPGLAR